MKWSGPTVSLMNFYKKPIVKYSFFLEKATRLAKKNNRVAFSKKKVGAPFQPVKVNQFKMNESTSLFVGIKSTYSSNCALFLVSFHRFAPEQIRDLSLFTIKLEQQIFIFYRFFLFVLVLCIGFFRVLANSPNL